ncbi:MAG: ABC transporter permease [Mesorhizobium sp.]|uniref:ABC transporter permease n=1 Tax=unclassified Mesorhizobium TaxID=325217 RepID=UPI000FCB2D26|nr:MULTISPECIES: ABC transporter permease [unclassified Mesorhizobium]RUX37237.1 ABC transporter permease [Mesorhizobium sp. M4A.F.Ca.ET.050.02.1.1]RWD04772.1 MAG: ABC transporter permease [Mesorhizobium sp.]RWD23129.1 MAG: ABC transporter permease [Mesorhizobium sp.]TIW23190.1 MAG: ABC transporter permease subunit [Mesorhizobium sp.]
MLTGRTLSTRTASLLFTLWLVSVLVFLAGQVLPGDVGRVMLGPFADAQAVAALNRQLGADQPVLVQYWHWFSRALTGDFGTSLSMRAPVAPFVLASLGRSAALAGIILLLLVPVGVGAGIIAGLNQGRLIDRLIVLAGVSFGIVPDFVSGLLLLMVFGLWLSWFPITGAAPDGAGFWTSGHYLILPALPLVLNLTGYLARMTRAGVVEALAADYTRTATLKGLDRSQVIVRHVLPNALTPTIAVLATQSGYMLGGLVVIEALFGIQGLGNLVLNAAKSRDFPMLEAGVLVMATIFVLSAAAGDLVQALLDPRQRRRASL